MSKIAQKITESYKKRQKKSALAMLKSLSERIQRDEVYVESAGFWAGMPGSYTLKIQVLDKDLEEK